ncbi:MAG: Heme O synthase, protoheme IX farnesyltransferase COX10-CtaB, partial [uncultured Blastococcus sp.]
DGAVAAPRRSRPPPARPGARPPHRLRGADQAAHHRAPAGHHRAGHDAGRARLAVAVAAAVHPARRHARRRCGQRLQLLLRPRHRPADAAHPEAAAGHRAGVPTGGAGLRRRPHDQLDRAAGGHHHAARRRPRRGRDLLLRRPLHDGVQAAHPPEHGVRWRAGGRAGADRLGRGHRFPRLAGDRRVRRRLLLADAALLGARAAVQGGLRAGRRPDAAGGRHRAVGRPAVGLLELGDRRRLAAAVAGRRGLRHRAGLHDRGRGPRRLVHRGGAPAAAPDHRRRRHQAHAVVPRLDLVPGAADGRDRRRRHRL